MNLYTQAPHNFILQSHQHHHNPYDSSIKDCHAQNDGFVCGLSVLYLSITQSTYAWAYMLQIYVSKAKRKVLEALCLPKEYRNLLTENDLEATIQAVRSMLGSYKLLASTITQGPP